MRVDAAVPERVGNPAGTILIHARQVPSAETGARSNRRPRRGWRRPPRERGPRGGAPVSRVRVARAVTGTVRPDDFVPIIPLWRTRKAEPSNWAPTGPRSSWSGSTIPSPHCGAGAYAAGLARRQGARLVCVYVEQVLGLLRRLGDRGGRDRRPGRGARRNSGGPAATGAGGRRGAGRAGHVHRHARRSVHRTAAGGRRGPAPTPSSWAPRPRPATAGSGRWRSGWSRRAAWPVTVVPEHARKG